MWPSDSPFYEKPKDDENEFLPPGQVEPLGPPEGYDETQRIAERIRQVQVPVEVFEEWVDDLETLSEAPNIGGAIGAIIDEMRSHLP